MPKERLHVLFLSDLFPNPAWPTFGIFVERQASHLLPYCDVTAVVPVRVFPHLRLWRHILQPRQFSAAWQEWRAYLAQIPQEGEINGLPVYYPRYTSLPRQGFHGLWGFFAYPRLKQRLLALHQAKNFDLIHAHYASPAGVIALLARRWMNVPVALSVHGFDVTYTAKQNPLSKAIVRQVFSSVEAIIANSTWTAEQIVQLGGSPQKVQVVRLGGNAPKHFQEIEIQAKPGTKRLLSVANLFASKGHAYVLKAMRRLVDMGYALEYTVVGDGPERDRLQRLAEELHLQNRVHFTGAIAHDDVWPYYAACDIFVLPSWIEGFGIVFIEALGLGKPVIGCEGTGEPEDLKSLGNCISLVKPRDVHTVVEALKCLLDDAQQGQRMAEIGRKIVAEQFTWERNAADTWQLYQRLTGRR